MAWVTSHYPPHAVCARKQAAVTKEVLGFGPVRFGAEYHDKGFALLAEGLESVAEIRTITPACGLECVFKKQTMNQPRQE